MIAASHPEQALERAIAGTLAEAERESLEQHLAACVACRAHLALASAAQDSFQVQAEDEHADQLNIERALARMEAPPSHAAGANPPARRARYEARAPRRTVHRSIWLGAAALLVFGGVAAAAWLQRAPSPSPQEAKSAVVPPASPPQVVARSTSVEPPQPLSAPEATPPAPSATPLRSAPESASSLFRKASGLRADGEADAAIATFLKLQKLFPESRESRLSLLVAGRLLLERGRPAQALAEFDRYLTESGSTSEHALAGRAAALQALGRGDAEASTWQRLISAFPRSVYDKRAKARLAELRPARTGSATSTGVE